ncbi:MAG: zf-HC2 domain-containing protein [Casimicrobiaceae bacterium]
MPRAALVCRDPSCRLTYPTAPGQLGPLISCKDASRLISQMQDGTLPRRRRWLVRLHLAWCEACRRFERQLAVLREAIRHYRQ